MWQLMLIFGMFGFTGGIIGYAMSIIDCSTRIEIGKVEDRDWLEFFIEIYFYYRNQFVKYTIQTIFILVLLPVSIYSFVKSLYMAEVVENKQHIENCHKKFDGITNPELRHFIINSCKVDYNLKDTDIK